MVRLHQFPQPTEGIHYVNDNMGAFVDSKDLGTGKLYVTEGNISWINGTSGEGFSISYPKMTLHAVSKDEAVHPKPCLYIMLNGYLDEDGTKQAEVEPDEDAEGNDDEDDVITEVRFIPEDPAILETVYKAVQECTILHPDPASDMSDEEDDLDQEEDNEEMYDAEEDCDDEAEADAGFNRLMQRFGLPRHDDADDTPDDPDQFKDAE